VKRIQHPGEVGTVSVLRDKWERRVFARTGRWPDSKVERRLAYSDRPQGGER
jgi:hypothetical protein